MEVPSEPPAEVPRLDACADIMRQILTEVAMDLGDQVQPGSDLTGQIMDGQVPFVTTDGPDGKTTVFWCDRFNGACSYSFLLREGKPGLPPDLNEAAMAVSGVCLQNEKLRRAFKRARDATRKALGEKANDPEWRWLQDDW